MGRGSTLQWKYWKSVLSEDSQWLQGILSAGYHRDITDFSKYSKRWRQGLPFSRFNFLLNVFLKHLPFHMDCNRWCDANEHTWLDCDSWPDRCIHIPVLKTQAVSLTQQSSPSFWVNIRIPDVQEVCVLPYISDRLLCGQSEQEVRQTELLIIYPWINVSQKKKSHLSSVQFIGMKLCFVSLSWSDDDYEVSHWTAARFSASDENAQD